MAVGLVLREARQAIKRNESVSFEWVVLENSISKIYQMENTISKIYQQAHNYVLPLPLTSYKPAETERNSCSLTLVEVRSHTLLALQHLSLNYNEENLAGVVKISVEPWAPRSYIIRREKNEIR